MKSDPGSQLSYELIRSKKRKKTLTLQIKRDGSVVLLAPERVSRAEIDRFFRDKEPWVRKKITERAENPERPGQEKKFISGETFLYHGEHYPLKIIETENGVPLSLCYGAFILRSDKSAEGRKLFMEWYRRQAKEEFDERLARYGGRYNLIPKGLTITSARTRYGSCSASNRISLTWRLVMAPYSVIDYVILHELAHIKIKNHSRQFWDFLETMVSDYRDRRLWLREHGRLLVI